MKPADYAHVQEQLLEAVRIIAPLDLQGFMAESPVLQPLEILVAPGSLLARRVARFAAALKGEALAQVRAEVGPDLVQLAGPFTEEELLELVVPARVTVSSLVVGQKVRIKHGNAWYVAAVEHLGRTRVTVVFVLKGDRRAVRRRTVPAAELRPLEAA